MTEKEHKQLTFWAAECAGHVLYIFEEYSKDARPRNAIEAAKAWSRGEIKIGEARKFAFAAHAAARETNNLNAKAAARAAGHAAATAHVSTHAKYAAQYAIKAAFDKEMELNWQKLQLPVNLIQYVNFEESIFSNQKT